MGSSFLRFGLNVTSTVVKDTTKRDIRRGEEGKAGRGENEEKESGVGILSLIFSYSLGFLQSHPTSPSQKRQTRTLSLPQSCAT